MHRTTHHCSRTVARRIITRRTPHYSTTSTLYSMSGFARSPERHAAWQQLKRNVALRPHDDEQRAQRNRSTQELHRLLSRTSISIIAQCSCPCSCSRCSKRFTIRSPHYPRIWEQKYIDRTPGVSHPRICASPISRRASRTTAACSTNISDS
jgi:hypothetical protein